MTAHSLLTKAVIFDVKVDGVKFTPKLRSINGLESTFELDVCVSHCDQVVITLYNKGVQDPECADTLLTEDVNVSVSTLRVNNIDLTDIIDKISIGHALESQPKYYRTNGWVIHNGHYTINIGQNYLYKKWLFGLLS